MAEVTFKTLDAHKIRETLMGAVDRLSVIHQVVDQIWNTVETCEVLPILDDTQRVIGDVWEDIDFDAKKEETPSDSENQGE